MFLDYWFGRGDQNATFEHSYKTSYKQLSHDHIHNLLIRNFQIFTSDTLFPLGTYKIWISVVLFFFFRLLTSPVKENIALLPIN